MARERSIARHGDVRGTTERLLDVLLDVRGVRASFIVDDGGELAYFRCRGRSPSETSMEAALDSVVRLRQAATSGLDAEKSIVAQEDGLLFVRRARNVALCALTVRQPDLKSLEMTSRLVARSLPSGPPPLPKASWAVEDDERATLPWLPDEPDYPSDVSPASLRPPPLPRELADGWEHAKDRRESGVRLAPRASRRRRRPGRAS